MSSAALALDPALPQAAAGSALLTLTGLTKRFGALTALSGVTLDVKAGEVHCLLGENGAGKSTLCNLVFGVHEPTEGVMMFGGKPYKPTGPADALNQGIAMVHQHFSLVGDMTVVDNLLLGQEKGILKRRACAEKVIALGDEYGLTVDPYARIADLSVGERQRVEIVKCLMRRPKLLVLDEPTAVLLPDEIQALLTVCRKVAEGGCGVVLVTHKLAEIKKVADRATVLRGGKVVSYSDAPARDIDALVRAMIQRELGGLDKTTAATLGMAEAAPEAAPAKEKPLIPPREALQIDGISYRDPAGVMRLDNLTLTIAAGEIVGIAGVEGNGQTELGNILAGLLRPTAGKFYAGDKDLTGRSPKEITEAGIGIVPEDRHAVGCITGMSVTQNIFLNRLQDYARFGFLDRAAMRARALELMQEFDVRALSPDVPFSALSGGNQQKAVVARELTTKNLRFLLAAQPTRGLDVGAVESIYNLIRAACKKGAGVLLVSSELDELIAVADRIVVLYRGRIMGEKLATPAYREAIGALMSGHVE